MNILFIFTFCLVFGKISARSEDNLKEILNNVFERLETLSKDLDLDPETGKTIDELMKGYNYPLESHNVTTQDGYILTVHRIPYGRNTTLDKLEADQSKPIVFFQHCLECSSIDWLTMGPQASLPLLLADIGYDIWLGNGRGNIFGMTHATLNPDKDDDFWDYSFNEKGLFDLPASIDYVLNQTGQSNLTYVGHSQGTTEFLVMASEHPQYNEKINLMVALAPVAYMGNITGPIPRILAKYMDVIKTALDLFGIHGIPYSKWISVLVDTFCNDQSPLQDVCAVIVELFVGFDIPQMNKTRFSVTFSNTPAGMSIKELLHFGQEIRSEYFRKFDYGIANLLHYGSLDPPSYNIKKITVPVAAYYGKNDFMAAVSDVERLLSELPNVVKSSLIQYDYFNHLDFIWAIDVKTLLYDDVIEVVNSYNRLI